MENHQQTTVIIAQPKKSMILGLILTFFFGPLGMLYSTIAGGVIMFILTPLVGILTFGLGLLIMWPVQLIWTGISISMHNKKCGDTTVTTTSSSTFTPESPTAVVGEKVQLSKKNLPHYDEANRLSDEKIKELLANRDELGSDFVEALKFVNTERVIRKEADQSRKALYEKALLIDDEERKNRIASPSLYSELSISALEYIQRCIECGMEPSTTGFLATFDEGYIAPETPKEREAREKYERDEAERQIAEQAAEAKAQKRAKRGAYIAIITTIVIVSLLCVYLFIIVPTNQYNDAIEVADQLYTQTINGNNIATKNECIQLYNKAMRMIPPIGSDEKLEYINQQKQKLYTSIDVLSAIEAKRVADKKAEAEAKKKADNTARRKADEAAKQKAVAENEAAAKKAEEDAKKAEAAKARNTNVISKETSTSRNSATGVVIKIDSIIDRIR